MNSVGRIPKTALDVFRLLPEGTLCEVIDNVLYMSPAPFLAHQRLLGALYRAISQHVQNFALGETYIAPFDVYFEALQSAVQPDLFVVLNEKNDLVKDDGVYGAPDLVVEVLSKDKKRDMVEMKALYKKAAVTEYVIVDPFTKVVTSWVLVDGVYQLQQNKPAVFKSSVINFELNL